MKSRAAFCSPSPTFLCRSPSERRCLRYFSFRRCEVELRIEGTGGQRSIPSFLLSFVFFLSKPLSTPIVKEKLLLVELRFTSTIVPSRLRNNPIVLSNVETKDESFYSLSQQLTVKTSDKCSADVFDSIAITLSNSATNLKTIVLARLKCFFRFVRK